MVETDYPGTREVTGVFLLKDSDLKELDNLLAEAKKEMQVRFRAELKRAVDEETMRRGELGSRSLEDQEKRRKEIRAQKMQYYPFSRRKCEVVVYCRSRKMVKASGFSQILSSPEMQNEDPGSATATITFAEALLEVRLFSQVTSGIEISVSPSDTASSHRIMGKLVAWAESKQRFRLWSSGRFVLGFAGFLLLMSWVALFPFGTIYSESGKWQLLRQAQEVTRAGVTTANQAQATEILLRLFIGDYEQRKLSGGRCQISNATF